MSHPLMLANEDPQLKGAVSATYRRWRGSPHRQTAPAPAPTWAAGPPEKTMLGLCPVALGHAHVCTYVRVHMCTCAWGLHV